MQPECSFESNYNVFKYGYNREYKEILKNP